MFVTKKTMDLAIAKKDKQIDDMRDRMHYLIDCVYDLEQCIEGKHCFEESYDIKICKHCNLTKSSKKAANLYLY